MSKYFIKIVTGPLITLVFLLGSNFCFQGILVPAISQGLTPAQTSAPMAVNYNDNNSALETDFCNEEQANISNTDFAISTSPASHHNSLLPCCVDNGQPSVVTLNQSLEVNRVIPVAVFFDSQLLKMSPELNYYHTPIIAPPELLAVQITVLRL